MTTGVPLALLALGALAGSVIALFGLRAMPRLSFVLWAAVLFLVPVWVGVGLGIHWPAIIALTVMLLLANRSVVPLHPVDLVMGCFAALVLGLHLLGGVTLGAAVTAVLEWVIPYIWGRTVLARVSTGWVTSTLTAFALVAAGLAVVEFVTSFNLFVLIPGSEPLYSAWNTLQERGGVLRAEGAFGHSIALGATLAMSCAFAIAAPWRTAPKILAVTLLAGATVLTFSRTGLITMVLSVVLSVWLLPGISRRLRLIATGAGALAALVVLPVIQGVLGAAGDEAAGSAGYRTDLLVLLGQVRIFGDAGPWQTLVTGDYYLGYFARSVDNAVVLTLLRYGLVPALAALGVVLWAALQMLRQGSRGPASIAVMSQLPGLVVVALITQYGAFLWFCAGLALTWRWAREREGAHGALDSADGALDRTAGVVDGPPGVPDPSGERGGRSIRTMTPELAAGRDRRGRRG